MHQFRLALLALVCPSLATGTLWAQSAPPPRITVVMPPGAKAGATVDFTVTGQELNNVEGLYFSFPGARVEVLAAADAPKDPKAKTKGGKAPAVMNRKFRVAIPGNAPLGTHDLRVVTKGGVSNPRAFVVGDLDEVVEKETNDDVPVAHRIELNTTVSGVISTPTDVDYFVFTGRKGQRVVVSCLTTSVDSKLPALVQVFSSDAAARQLGFSRGYANNDAVADALLPADGDYYIRVCSFTYTQGGPDYFYRLSVGTAPWIDAVFPPLVEAGRGTKVTVHGRNLPGGVLDPKATLDERPLEKAVVAVKAPGDPLGDPLAPQRLAFRGFVPPPSALLDGFEHRLRNDAGVSNPALVGIARGALVIDNDANDSLAQAQDVPTPCEIGGRVEKKGDRDCYRFRAGNGQVLSIELFADRLGSAMDMEFTVHNAKGDKLADQDDNPDILAPQLFNRSDDPPRLRFTAPADGVYTLVVSSKEAFLNYGPRHVYTVRIGPDEPDFRVIAMPMSNFQIDSVVLGQTGHQGFTIFVGRSGGFTGDVTIAAEKLPKGLTMRPQVIAGNQKQAAAVISAAADAPPYVGPIRLMAAATIGGKKISREVRAASITWSVNQQQQNTPTVTRLDRELIVAVRDKAPYTLAAEKTQFTVPQGNRISIPLQVTANDYKGNVQITALALPTGMALQPVTIGSGQKGTINLDSKTTVLPGNYTVVLRGQTQPPPPNQQPKPGAPRNIVQTAPPIAVTIVPKQLAKVAAPQNNPKIKAGGQTEVVIKIARQFGYDGPFKVEIDPKATKGIAASAVTIKAGADEAKLMLSAAPGTPAGSNASVTVRVTAMFNDTLPVVHEAKFSVAIVK
ncbi:MAG: PPC domain-containing protein [Gemmataceae bacterium]|nr:PPC domain-containing protein [Gemmataceae bacterium]